MGVEILIEIRKTKLEMNSKKSDLKLHYQERQLFFSISQERQR